jgi:hypothetical protein
LVQFADDSAIKIVAAASDTGRRKIARVTGHFGVEIKWLV